MPSYKLTLAYDGTDFAGWQAQPNGRTVQETLEAAWRLVTGESRRLTASGRTDAGVHALGQVVSVATESQLPPETLRRALNANLPEDVHVLSVDAAAAGFHAIRDAVAKSYRYAIQDGPVTDIFQRRYAWRIPRRLNAAAMSEAAAALIGVHDFSSFEAAGSPRASSVRTVTELSVARTTAEVGSRIHIEVQADGFLYNMVRNIVGTLAEVGREKQSVAWPGQVLGLRDRARAGPTAPPHGLFLLRVWYDPASEPDGLSQD